MDRYQKILDQLDKEHNLRQLRTVERRGKMILHDNMEYLDLCSNDYLGLSGDVDLQLDFMSRLDPDRFWMSNPSSRLLGGNSIEYEELEQTLSRLYGGRSTLVFGSGYAINSGVLPALTTSEDTILVDRLAHASIVDGMLLCKSRWNRFRHNDLGHLEDQLKKIEQHRLGDVWVVTESVFSMDGDIAPLKALVELKRRYGFKLYLDEAHGFGVFGKDGKGVAEMEGVLDEVDILVGTFGKAIASTGGFVVCSPQIREMLVNRARTLIFSTAIPPINLAWTRYIVERLPLFEPKRNHLRELWERFGNEQKSQIVPIMAYENSKALEMADRFRTGGYWTSAIRYPTVPQGLARVRISLSAATSIEEIDKFIALWRAIG